MVLKKIVKKMKISILFYFTLINVGGPVQH